MNWLLRFVPEDKRQMILLAQRIVSCLDTAEERNAAILYGQAMLADGKVSVSEWARFGGKLGILKGRH
ncbi:hypothetical protein [uncultured Mediterranean phage uvDeep-CGR2-KM21-C338]|nr:hypothetical protein [uncultured Mediterranean phage uvDeep-CGR2-KM21-C338]